LRRFFQKSGYFLKSKENTMNDANRLAELERKIQYLLDRQEILDCIARNARGNDRFDLALTTGSYHADGFPVLGPNQTPSSPTGEQASGGYAHRCHSSMHNLTTHTCEIDGDTAHAESYVIGLFVERDGATARAVTGRYIDRLEKRDGAWKIALRRATLEIMLEGQAKMPNGANLPGSHCLKGSRDPTDPSYERPLTATSGARW
jgi:hypothetical protein